MAFRLFGQAVAPTPPVHLTTVAKRFCFIDELELFESDGTAGLAEAVNISGASVPFVADHAIPSL
jgi:hypothetical protein